MKTKRWFRWPRENDLFRVEALNIICARSSSRSFWRVWWTTEHVCLALDDPPVPESSYPGWIRRVWGIHKGCTHRREAERCRRHIESWLPTGLVGGKWHRRSASSFDEFYLGFMWMAPKICTKVLLTFGKMVPQRTQKCIRYRQETFVNQIQIIIMNLISMPILFLVSILQKWSFVDFCCYFFLSFSTTYLCTSENSIFLWIIGFLWSLRVFWTNKNIEDWVPTYSG